jgi:predicted outer membrane protein
VADKNKVVQKELKEKLETLKEKEKALEILEKEKQVTIEEHKKLSIARQEEQDAARKLRNEFETKLRKMREIATT